ncbi:MAG: bifunctional aspartate kinase/homoserine dehydrogenase I, partial [Bacteroidota bacterium]
LRAAAEANGKVLRFIATLEGEKAFISLQEVDESNPFFNLSGSDNMIVFTSERYKERPLVIKGPGAGAEVTAAGVFAEILRIGYYLS